MLEVKPVSSELAYCPIVYPSKHSNMNPQSSSDRVLPDSSETFAALKTQSKSPVSDAEMMQAVRTLLLGLGEDLDREGLRDTPKRVVKALKFLTQGYNQSLDELLNGAVFHENANEMVLVRDIDLFSSCEYHILPILGRAHVAYIPNSRNCLRNNQTLVASGTVSPMPTPKNRMNESRSFT